MTPPIKPAPTTPQRAAPLERPPAALGEKRPPLGSTRTDAQTTRSALKLASQEPTASADGLFFSQLLVPPVGAEPDQQRFAGGSLTFQLRTEQVPTQLIDELAQRLPDQCDGPLSFTLLMPNLGKVRVNANKADNRWSIELGFTRRDVLKRLHGHVGACRDALSHALGQDVELALHEDLEA